MHGVSSRFGKGEEGAHPTTSSGFLTIAMERWVRSYTRRAM